MEWLNGYDLSGVALFAGFLVYGAEKLREGWQQRAKRRQQMAAVGRNVEQYGPKDSPQ